MSVLNVSTSIPSPLDNPKTKLLFLYVNDAKNELNLNKPIKRSTNSKLDKDSFKFLSDFEKYMDDDLNTSGALSILFELSQPIRKCLNLLKGKDINEVEKDILNQVFNKWELLSELAGVLGLKVNLNQEKQKKIMSIVYQCNFRNMYMIMRFNFKNKLNYRRSTSNNIVSFGKSSCRVTATPRTFGSLHFP